MMVDLAQTVAVELPKAGNENIFPDFFNRWQPADFHFRI
jgi:hypothetical protein